MMSELPAAHSKQTANKKVLIVRAHRVVILLHRLAQPRRNRGRFVMYDKKYCSLGESVRPLFINGSLTAPREKEIAHV